MPAAIVAILFCTTPSHAHPKYGLIDHCTPVSAYSDFEVWDKADNIVVAHVSDDAEYDEKKWWKAEFQIEDVLLGNLKKGTKATIFAYIGGDFSGNTLDAAFRRAALHESPKFIPLYLTRFRRFGAAAESPDAECYPVPTVLKNVSYVIVRAGLKVLSVEPVFKPSDYWLQFLKSLKYMGYWQWRAIREKFPLAPD